MAQENLISWFSEVEACLLEDNLFAVLGNPANVLNADKTPF